MVPKWRKATYYKSYRIQLLGVDFVRTKINGIHIYYHYAPACAAVAQYEDILYSLVLIARDPNPRNNCRRFQRVAARTQTPNAETQVFFLKLLQDKISY